MVLCRACLVFVGGAFGGSSSHEVVAGCFGAARDGAYELSGEVTKDCLVAAAEVSESMTWSVRRSGRGSDEWRTTGERVVDGFLAQRPWWHATRGVAQGGFAVTANSECLSAQHE